MEIKKIVVGIDFSHESEVALDHALAIGRHTGAEVVMVHAGTVFEPLEKVEGPNPSLVAEYQEILSEHQSEVRAQLAELRERHEGQGVKISHSLIDGFADTALCEASEELGADLTLVGTHGRTGVKRFFLGSVAEKVVRLCDNNVMVARPGKSAGGYHRILVPTDFSPAAQRALEVAVAVAAPEAEIDVFHCWQLPIPVTSHYVPLSPRMESIRQLALTFEAEAKKRAEPILERYAGANVTLHFDTVQSAPAQGITERAPGYDLITMGSHGHRGLRRFILGSVAEATVRHAPCSVLVVHPAAEGGESK